MDILARLIHRPIAGHHQFPGPPQLDRARDGLGASRPGRHAQLVIAVGPIGQLEAWPARAFRIGMEIGKVNDLVRLRINQIDSDWNVLDAFAAVVVQDPDAQGTIAAGKKLGLAQQGQIVRRGGQVQKEDVNDAQEGHARGQGGHNGPAHEPAAALLPGIQIGDLGERFLDELFGSLTGGHSLKSGMAFLGFVQGHLADGTALAVLFDVFDLPGGEDVVPVVIDVVQDVGKIIRHDKLLTVYRLAFRYRRAFVS